MPNLRLPKVGLVEIIREVDSWTNYSRELKEGVARNLEHDSLKYAALMGNACNISLADLAASAVRSFFRFRLSILMVGCQQLF